MMTDPSPEGTLAHLEVRVVVFSLRGERLHVLLAPCAESDWQLPGGEARADAALEETAMLTVLRLAHLREAYLEQLYTYGEANRCVETLESSCARVISVVYFAIIPAGAGDASEAARWFALEQMPALVLDHAEIVAYALRRLRYKLEYTAVGFQLLPENFSLSELQQVYEIILGEVLDKRNFRRRILKAGIIEETLHLRAGEGRPARLYRYQPDAVAEVKVRRLFP